MISLAQQYLAWFDACYFSTKDFTVVYLSYVNDDRNQFRLFAGREWSYFGR